MSELKQFRLPDVGEGLTEADIVRWHVHPGDKVTVNQIIVEIETAKAVVELPSPYEGVVADLLVPEGSTADVGSPIIAVRVGEAGPDDAGAGGDTSAAEAVTGIGSPPAEGAVEPGMHGSPAPKVERQAVLVGYGVKLGATKRRARKAVGGAVSAAVVQAPAPAVAPAVASATAPAAAQAAAQAAGANGAADGHLPQAGTAVLAKPPVRKLARDLGVDLSQLTGTGPAGSITRDDVQAAIGAQAAGAAGAAGAVRAAGAAGAAGAAEAAGAAGAAEAAGAAAMPAGEPGLDRVAAMRLASLPREERIPIRGVRKHTAAAMAASAFTAPHVSEFLQIDITETMTATARIRSLPEFDGVRVSPLLLVAKALLIAAARHPLINSSWDEAAQEIVVKHYVNLGIAAATDRGLIVPSVKDAHALSLPELARALAGLAETARAGKSSPADLRGGTITITNVGVFGVDTGTPIITPGEAAILAFGQIKDAPWVLGGQLAVRKVCTLALSFDHRIVDGDLGSAVLRDVGAMLTDPLRMLAWS